MLSRWPQAGAATPTPLVSATISHCLLLAFLDKEAVEMRGDAATFTPHGKSAVDPAQTGLGTLVVQLGVGVGVLSGS